MADSSAGYVFKSRLTFPKSDIPAKNRVFVNFVYFYITSLAWGHFWDFRKSDHKMTKKLTKSEQLFANIPSSLSDKKYSPKSMKKYTKNLYFRQKLSQIVDF